MKKIIYFLPLFLFFANSYSQYRPLIEKDTLGIVKTRSSAKLDSVRIADSLSAHRTSIATKATDNLVPHIAGTETITGYKTFNDSLRLNNQNKSVFLSLDSAGIRTFEARQVLTGSDNTFFGLNAGKLASYGTYNSGTYGLITTNHYNTIFGANSGISLVTGNENTIFGSNAGTNLNAAGGDPNLVGALNTLIGSLAGNNVTNGNANTFIGQKAGLSMTSGVNNTFVGKASGEAMTGSQNTILGTSAGKFATTGSGNTFIGYNSGQNSTGSNNVFISGGANATGGSGTVAILGGNNLTSGVENSLIGLSAGSAITTGNDNTILGYQAGRTAPTGASYNTFLGAHAGENATGNGNIFIGLSAGDNETGNNQFIAGTGGSGGQARIDNVYFGRGKTHATPSAYAINGTGGSGADIAGADVNIAGGIGTGTGASGKVNFKVAPAAGSTSSTANTLVTAGQYDANTTSGETRFLLYDITAGTLKRVSIGAADSGGTGYKVLRIPN